MRVSKDVKRFIEEQVREIFKKDNNVQDHYKAREEEAKELIEEYNQSIIDFLKDQQQELNAELKDLGFESYVTTKWTDKSGFGCSINIFHLDHDSEMYKEQRRIENDRQTKIAKSIQDIIVTLELGGNKQDLMNMLEKLKENNK